MISISWSLWGAERSLVVNVTQTHYQAEQNHSITLEWTFTPKPDVSITSVYIFCQLVTDLRASVLFHLHEGVEVSESQDQQFSGRVQFDRDKLREGRIRLQVSRLRTDDSGRYDCTIRTSDGWNTDVCRLNVTDIGPQKVIGLSPVQSLTGSPPTEGVVIDCRTDLQRDGSWRKMIFRILLLISFISCVSGSLVVNVAQTHYQAEQNHSITLEWTFTPKPDVSITSVYIICRLVTDLRASVLFHLHEGVEVSESQDQQFSGRVQFDRDELREGRLRLQVSRLRTDDSGRYDCNIRTSDGWNMDVCRLNVTAAVDQHKAETTVSPEPENRGRTGLYAALVLTVAAALLFVCVLLFRFFVVLSELNLRKTHAFVFDQEVSYT
ncbi:uncharacterized protein LOC114867658 [Betta splendens]|uniref:Uncharacterized protein LOC114867658 n=1 Tax=Betta splendens TaxID=158456 RepID=A0A9W2Y821_BETSP|nr:uncharacterized protein LOC114867658 [Betta splendens]